jgi:parallel beta-helix repeat protein
MKHPILWILALAIWGCQSPNTEQVLSADDLVQTLQEKLITAEAGSTFLLPEGTFEFQNEISLDGVPNVTIKGAGMDKTILSFKGQVTGAQGLLVKSSDGITLEDFTVQDTKGDAIKVLESENVTFRKVNTTWTGGAQTSNGGYGLYPISCTNVLMEQCEASYASDAGIYIGQSTNVIVRDNYVHHNVAGLEIENTRNAEVYRNRCEGNTGGLLIFDMPDLPQANGYNVKVFDNRVVGNNHENFAPEGTVVSILPPGTGVLVLAHSDVEISNNIISEHKTTAVALTSWVFTGKPFESKEYNPFCSGLSIYDNSISKTVGPSDMTTDFGQLITALTQGQAVDIAIDGIFNPATLGDQGVPIDEDRICIRNNGDVRFLNLNAGLGSTPEEMAQNMDMDMSKFDCEAKKVEVTGHDDWLGEE